MLGCIRLIRKVNFFRFPSFGQIIKMSSMYLVNSMGLVSAVDCRNLLRSTEMKMLATVEAKAAPMAIPVVCRKWRLANSK